MYYVAVADRVYYQRSTIEAAGKNKILYILTGEKWLVRNIRLTKRCETIFFICLDSNLERVDFRIFTLFSTSSN